MLNKDILIDFLRSNDGNEFSKEELINRFAVSEANEELVDKLLSEIEVENTYNKRELIASCKGGTVYFKWVNE
jgi:hypothetical protein